MEKIVQSFQHSTGIATDNAWSALTHWKHQVDDRNPLIGSLPELQTSEDWETLFESAASFPNPPVVKLKALKSDKWIDFTFMDLFAGIGGFHLALASQGGNLVFASEWDNAARLTYLANHGVYPFGDIRQFTRDEHGNPLPLGDIKSQIPHADIIAAGFPCQPFSTAGVSSRNHHGHSHGLLCEAQGTLFEDILLIAKATKPDALILENVGNLRFHDAGNTIRVILQEIEASGYKVHPEWDDSSNWAVLNSSLVSAQRRRRVYLTCIRQDLAKKLYDQKGSFEISPPKQVTKYATLRQIIERDRSLSESEKQERFGISERLWKSHLRRQDEHRKKGNGFRIGLMTDLETVAPTLVARYYKDGKDCLIPAVDGKLPPRMLSPQECSLLQTYPTSFRIPNSKTAAYKQFGNSVTVEMVRHVSRELVDYLYA